MNKLFFGDNLDILRDHVPPESVDLVYLDPPFNSDANYNIIFREHNEALNEAQAEAFKDTWKWDEPARDAYDDVINHGGGPAEVLSSLRAWLGTNGLMAYLSNMTARLIEMRVALKPSGSLFLHCDPTASHYLKLILDSVFGHKSFQNEVI
jgi:adenine specific DNA methylase Mod